MSQSLSCIQKALSSDSLSAYVGWVNSIPMLSLEEEQEYAHRLRENNELEAARKLILSHLRLVVRIARGYNGYGLAQADLIQEGNIGLMKAVKRFNPEVGVRLVSFAIHWIRAEIHEFILKNWRIVKVATTKAQRKLFFNLRKAAKKRGWFSDDEVKTIANELNVSEKDVRQMESRLNAYDQSFDAYSDDADDNSEAWAPANYLEDHSTNPERTLVQNDQANNHITQLRHAMTTLDARSQDILQQRWLNDKKATLHTLAAKYNISAERIRQLEQNAMLQIREKLSNAA